MRRDLFICSLCWLLIPLSCGYMDPCCTPEQKHWKHLKSHTLILTLAGPPKNSSILYFFVIWSVNNLQSGKCPETGKRQNPFLRKSLGTPSTFLRDYLGFFFKWCIANLTVSFWFDFLSLLCCAGFNVCFSMHFKTLFPIWGKFAYIAFVEFLFLMRTRMFS